MDSNDAQQGTSFGNFPPMESGGIAPARFGGKKPPIEAAANRHQGAGSAIPFSSRGRYKYSHSAERSKPIEKRVLEPAIGGRLAFYAKSCAELSRDPWNLYQNLDRSLSQKIW